MHVDKVLCHGENGGARRETSHQGCIMRKVVSKEVTAGGRFDFFWTLALNWVNLYRRSKRACPLREASDLYVNLMK